MNQYSATSPQSVGMLLYIAASCGSLYTSHANIPREPLQTWRWRTAPGRSPSCPALPAAVQSPSPPHRQLPASGDPCTEPALSTPQPRCKAIRLTYLIVCCCSISEPLVTCSCRAHAVGYKADQAVGNSPCSIPAEGLSCTVRHEGAAGAPWVCSKGTL